MAIKAYRTAVSVTAKSYIVNLLNKFEVALTWDGRTLLIPSLLPTEAMMRSGVPGMDLRVKIAVRTRGWGFRSRRQIQNEASLTTSGDSSAASTARSRSVVRCTVIPLKAFSHRHHNVADIT